MLLLHARPLILHSSCRYQCCSSLCTYPWSTPAAIVTYILFTIIVSFISKHLVTTTTMHPIDLSNEVAVQLGPRNDGEPDNKQDSSHSSTSWLRRYSYGAYTEVLGHRICKLWRIKIHSYRKLARAIVKVPPSSCFSESKGHYSEISRRFPVDFSNLTLFITHLMTSLGIHI